MKADLKTGIILGAAICIPGIVYIPPGTDAITAAAVCGGLGLLALLGVVWRDHPASVGVGMTAVAILGGYALMAGVVTGPAALGVGLLALAATAALVARAVPVRPMRRPASP